MEPQAGIRTLAFAPLAIIVLVFLAGGAAFLFGVARRKSPAATIVTFLGLGFAAIIAAFGGYALTVSDRVVRRDVAERRTADEKRLYFEQQQFGHELPVQVPVRVGRKSDDRSLDLFWPVVPSDPSQPVEAPRPGATANGLGGTPEPSIAKSVTTLPLPDWTQSPVSVEGDRKLVVVQSEQFADAATATKQALHAASELVRRDFEKFNEVARDSWSLDQGTVRSAAVRRTFTEPIERTAGENEFTVYRTYLLVELSPDVRDLIEPIWREQVSQGRSLVVMIVFGVLTAFASVIAGLFRLDDRTGGRHRLALGFAATAAVLLLSGVGVAGLRTARVPPIAVPEAPIVTPPARELAPPPPVRIDPPPMVDQETRERFQLVASEIIDAINAADYEGVRRDFDKVMLDRFPVEECRIFYS